MTKGWVNSTWLMMTVTRPSFRPTLTKKDKQRHGEHQRRQHHRQGQNAHGQRRRAAAACDTSPIAAMVPTMAEIDADAEPDDHAVGEGRPELRDVPTISAHQRSDRLSIGKLVSPREVKEKTISSTIGDSRKTTSTSGNEPPALQRQPAHMRHHHAMARLNSQITSTEAASMTNDMAEPSGQLNIEPNCGAMRLPMSVCLPPTSSGVT